MEGECVGVAVNYREVLYEGWCNDWYVAGLGTLRSEMWCL